MDSQEQTTESGSKAKINAKGRLCVVVASPMTAEAFLRDQLCHLGEEYELSVVANSPDDSFLKRIGAKADFVPIRISRRIDLVRDLGALVALMKVFRERKFDLVHSVTPKAGLLSMIAAAISRIPTRIHTFTGQVWATKRGVSRFFFKCMDRLLAHFATHILVDSFSQRAFLIENRVVSEKKASVLGSGSISGVDIERFCPDPEGRISLRAELEIPDQSVLFLYVGRLNRDKGIPELLSGFESVLESAGEGDVWLLIVGPDEEELEKEIRESSASVRIRRVGYTNEPERYMAAADVFVLPSHREGFGSTVIEAAATGIPTVASRIYGLSDAVEDGETGILHESGNVEELASAMLLLAQDKDMRLVMGEKARQRALREFSMDGVTGNTLEFYRSISGVETSKSR